VGPRRAVLVVRHVRACRRAPLEGAVDSGSNHTRAVLSPTSTNKTAARMGVAFDNTPLLPVVVSDVAGVSTRSPFDRASAA
jgi:hypothetical protein